MSKKEQLSVREKAHPVACVVQDIRAEGAGLCSDGLVICDTCQKWSQIGTGEVSGYCHLDEHNEPPKTGFCTEYIPVTGIVTECSEEEGYEYNLNLALVGSLI